MARNRARLHNGPLAVPGLRRTLKELREERGLSQEAAALARGIDRAHFGNLERAVKTPALGTVWRIADAFETRPSALLARAERLVSGP